LDSIKPAAPSTDSGAELKKASLPQQESMGAA